jgi:hypothetical protein
MVEDSKTYEQLEYESKLERLRRDRQTQDFWDDLNRPDNTRLPSNDPLGPEAINQLPGSGPRPRGYDRLCPPSSMIDHLPNH